MFRSPIETILFDAMMEGKVFLDFFSYSATWNTLGANATTTQTTTVNADSDFVIQQLNLASFSAANTIVANPDYLLMIVDAGSGRQLFDASQHVSCVTGQQRDSGAMPWPLPMAKLIRQASTIAATLTNNTNQASLVNLSYVGFKVFYQNSNTRASVVGIN